MTPHTALIDADDLLHEDQLKCWIEPLHEAVPEAIFTLYSVPMYLGPVHELKERYPYVIFGVHGLNHALMECCSWNDDIAKANVELALSMGYAPLFKPPNWSFPDDADERRAIEAALRDLGVVLHCHEDYRPQARGLKYWSSKDRSVEYVHTHIQRNPSTDFIETHPSFRPEYLATFVDFTDPMKEAREVR